MGMPCEVNSVLKLTTGEGYPDDLIAEKPYRAVKLGYRILPIDVPVMLVDQHWITHAEVIIQCLTWQAQATHLTFVVHKIYDNSFSLKESVTDSVTDK